jgi:hypothetical protein
MPCHGSVRAWARRDAGFAAALAQARADGQYRRDAVVDWAKARVLLDRLANGEGIVSVLRDPAMPSRRVYRLWRVQDAEFAEAVHRMNQATWARRAARGRARLRPFDPVLADRICARLAEQATGLGQILAADPALPSLGVVRRWRRQNAEFDESLSLILAAVGRVKRRRNHRSAALTLAICGQIRRGRTLAELGLRARMPCRATLYKWMRTDAGFRAAVAGAWRDRADMLADDVVDIAEDAARPAGRGRAVAGLKRTVAALDRRSERARPR